MKDEKNRRELDMGKQWKKKKKQHNCVELLLNSVLSHRLDLFVPVSWIQSHI